MSDDQAWFWTPEWQAKEREADEDIAAGRFERFYSDEAFLAAMQQEAAQDAPGQAQTPPPVSPDVAARERPSEGRRHLGPGWVAALYSGVCTTCGEPFGRATSIRKVRDGWQGRCCG
jgi:hypothetical protein